MELLKNLKWRYSTKKMDASKKVTTNDIQIIKEAIQLSPSSYGLQPYKVIEITEDDLKDRLRPMCWNQSQITDATSIFVFCNQTSVTDADIDNYLKLKAEINKIELDSLSGYGDFMKTKLKEKSSTEMLEWTAKQTYIALSNALVSCAELKVDSTPMEGFEVDKVNDLLQLADKGLNASVLLAIGYRHQEDQTQHADKVRKSMEELFIKA